MTIDARLFNVLLYLWNYKYHYHAYQGKNMETELNVLQHFGSFFFFLT